MIAARTTVIEPSNKDVPADSRHPQAHVHIDHLYVAVTNDAETTMPAELPFQWFSRGSLDRLLMLPDSRALAETLFAHLDDIVRHAA